MRTSNPNLLAACLASAIFAATAIPANAGPKFRIDGAHTTVVLRMGHHPWSTYQAVFPSVSGEITFDPANVKDFACHVLIYARSLLTFDGGRDAEAIGVGLLNVDKFPKITFDCTSVEVTGPASGKITGTLTMVGISKPVVLDTTYGGEATSSWDGSDRIGFSATGAISTDDFGLSLLHGMDGTSEKTYNIGPEMSIMIEVEAIR